MNNVQLIGRLTKDPSVNYTQGENAMCIARYTLAVNRRGKVRDGQPTADFITCVAFGKGGEFAEKYLKKGTAIAVIGHIQTGSYTNKDGQKVYTTDVVVDQHEFVGPRQGNESQSGQPQASAQTQVEDDGFMNIPEGIDEELPFN